MPTPNSDAVQTVEQAVAYVEKHQRQIGQDAKENKHNASFILSIYRLYKTKPLDPASRGLLIAGVNDYDSRFE